MCRSGAHLLVPGFIICLFSVYKCKCKYLSWKLRTWCFSCFLSTLLIDLRPRIDRTYRTKDLGLLSLELGFGLWLVNSPNRVLILLVLSWFLSWFYVLALKRSNRSFLSIEVWRSEDIETDLLYKCLMSRSQTLDRPTVFRHSEHWTFRMYWRHPRESSIQCSDVTYQRPASQESNWQSCSPLNAVHTSHTSASDFGVSGIGSTSYYKVSIW